MIDHTLEVRHFRFVQMIASEGSVTAAARKLHITQPALSRALSDLESRLGLALFTRMGRSLKPTAACRSFLAAADQVLTLVSAEEQRLKNIASGSSATIRLTTECYTCYRWLPPIIEQFHHASPAITIDIDAASTSNPLAAIQKGVIDLALVYTVPDGSPLEFVPLFEDELVVVVDPKHRFVGRNEIHASDFTEEHLIVYSEKGSDVINELLTPSGVRPKRVSSIQITDGILDMVKAGLGISVVAGWAAELDVADGLLVAIPIAGGQFVRRWKVACTKETFALPHVESFVDLLVENQRVFCGSVA